MAVFFKKDDMKFEPHPKFDGVKIAKLAGKAQDSAIGVSILLLSKEVEIPVHTHDENFDSIYCIEGNGEIYKEGSWHPLNQGDYCLVFPQEKHGVRCGKGGELKLFIVHTPPLF